ncbi:MAG: ribonuclease HIII [Ignavibacteriae bacterium]|nr:MAG: ribonuclease HIII [Ignavibacteriota bacterium]
MIKQKALIKIKEQRKNLISFNFNCTEIEEKQYNFEFTASKKNKNKIQTFFGKKGIKTVIQGNKETNEYLEINNILTENYSFTFLTENENVYDEYIGTDETGKGDFFGPLVIAGFYLKKTNQKRLKELGVKDSKELNDEKINKIASIIKKEFSDNYFILKLEPKEYNKLYEKYQNLNELLNRAHSMVIKKLLGNNQATVVITDKFSNKKLKIETEKKFDNTKFIQITKAEKYIGVAAASILARNEMNIWFEEKNKEGIDVIKGASDKVIDIAKRIYSDYGQENLSDFIKLHFKTTKKILEN